MKMSPYLVADLRVTYLFPFALVSSDFRYVLISRVLSAQVFSTKGVTPFRA